ncbi:MAG: TatD family hydrolase [Planctomycetota bacterium]|nr:TatD family hydrolase [Planctomycetota bacterium]
MKIFEPHIHLYARTTDDYERLALCGVRAVVEPSFWLGQPRSSIGTFVDYWASIRGYENQRAATYMIDQYHTISVNPREANDEGLATEALAAMVPFLDGERCVAVGEIGYDDITDAEERIMVAQIEMAIEHDMPLLIHSPHREKRAGTQRNFDILREMGVSPDKVLYDHNTEETMDIVRDFGCWAGMTVYPGTKLSPARAANILETYGHERCMINSSADWGVSDPLMVPKTILELRRRGWEDERIETLVWNNPRDFYAQSGRLQAPTLDVAAAAPAAV